MQCDSWGVTSLFVGVLLQMVEISRVLQPGGVFVASTFLKTFSPLGELLGDDTVRPLNQVPPMCSHAGTLSVPAMHVRSFAFYQAVVVVAILW